MKPLFKEEIKMIYELGYDGIELSEGMFWIDNNIIKYIDDKTLKLIKVTRKYVDDKLNAQFKHYKLPKEICVQCWTDTIKINDLRLNIIEQDSINIINLNTKENYNKIALISTGKDGNVVNHLAKKSKFNFSSMFNNTSLDVADTYKMAKQISDIITNPKEGFYQWRDRLQYIPTRFNRACCQIFKEGNMINYLNSNEKYVFLLGMRNEESNTRGSYEDLWSNNSWSDNWYGILPIRKWSEFDVWLYILRENIPINEKYKKGYNRVGCGIACPYYTKFSWQLDRYWYPKQFKRWQNILKEDFINNEKWTRMNCTIEEYMNCWNGGSLRKYPTDEVIAEFANYKGINIEIAKKFFNHNCSHEGCKRKVIDSELVAMNMKLSGRNTHKFLCKKHLKEYYEISTEKYKQMIGEFKRQGCNLF